MAAFALTSFPAVLAHTPPRTRRRGRGGVRAARLAVRAGSSAQKKTAARQQTDEKIAEAQSWFGQLPRRAQMAGVGLAAGLTAAEGALAHGSDASMADLPAVLGGVGFALGMVVTGYVMAGKVHHGEEGQAESKMVCSESDEDEAGYVCDLVPPEVDLYRDTLLRYLGYSNECGEAFRPLVGNFWANMTYVVAVSYVCADAVDKGAKANRNSATNRASETFKRLDTDLNGYLTYDQVRTAFRQLRLPLTLEQVNDYLYKADVLKNNKITYDEFMWSVERADSELALLLDATTNSVSPEEILPNAVRGLGLHSNNATTETAAAKAELAAAEAALRSPSCTDAERTAALESISAVTRRLATVQAELAEGASALERLEGAALSWKPKPFQATVMSAAAGVDALVWQLTASVAMPGFTINRIVTLTDMLCAEFAPSDGVLAQVAPYLPTVVGLAVIPLIVKPLDVLADVVLDLTLRRALFAAIDADNSGSLDVEELIEALSTRPEYLPVEKIRELFAEMDTNGDGQISMQEWSNQGFDLYKKYAQAFGASRQGPRAGMAVGK